MARTEGFVVWCPTCDHNVEGGQSANAEAIDRQTLELDAIIADAVPATVRANRLAVTILAGLVHASSLGLLVLGVVLLITQWPVPLAFVGLALVVLAVAIRPRLGHPPEGATELDLADVPALAELLHDIASQLGTTRPDRVYLEPTMNMGFGRVGLRRTSLLVIGVPLWLSLTPQMRIAALAHELAHDVNHDSRRGLFIGGAIETLARWHDALRAGPPPQRPTIPEYVAYLVFRIPLGAVAWVVKAWARGLYRATRERHRAAEFYADQLAADVASTSAMHDTLAGLLAARSNLLAMRQSMRRGEDVYEALVHHIERFPPHERERLQRVSRRHGTAVDDSHPSTAARLDAIAARRVPDEPIVSYPAEVDAEMATALEAERPAVRQHLASI